MQTPIAMIFAALMAFRVTEAVRAWFRGVETLLARQWRLDLEGKTIRWDRKGLWLLVSQKGASNQHKGSVRALVAHSERRKPRGGFVSPFLHLHSDSDLCVPFAPTGLFYGLSSARLGVSE